MSIVAVNEKGSIFLKEKIPTKCIGKIEEIFNKNIDQFVVPCEAIEFYW